MPEGSKPQLRKARDLCLERWQDRLRTTRWGGLAGEELADHLPDFYDALTELLESPPPPDFTAVEECARSHAERREAQGYELVELLQENVWLREVLGELDLGPEAYRLLTEALDRANLVSARIFEARRAAALAELRVRAEEVRNQHEEALAVMTDGFARLDDQFRFVFINPAGERLLGLENVATQGKPLWEALPGSDRTELGRLYIQSMREQQPLSVTSFFEPLQRWFEVRAFPGHHGLSIYFRDVTERLRHEQERERTLEALERGDALFIVDADWNIVYVNATQERMLKRPRETTVGRNLWDAYPEIATPDSRYWTEYHRAMRERVSVSFDECLPSLGIWTGVTAYPTREGGLVVFFRDITDRKRAEQAQERIFGVVGHDLRNPLAAIRLGIQGVLRMGDLPAQARSPLGRALRSVERMERMIGALLDYTRAQLGGGIPVTRAPADLAQTVRAVEEEYSLAHPDRLSVTIEGDLTGSFDTDRISQAISNLVTNALRHGDPRRPVSIHAVGTADEIRIGVHNDGKPIPEGLRERLFHPFEHGGSDSEGLGLGLYITCHIVQEHGGRIDLETSEGGGTTFTICLPRT